MSLSRKIAAALDGGPNDKTLPADLTIEDGASRLALHLTATGPVGLAFDRLEFAKASDAEWSSDRLQRAASGIASRLTYLMEPLVILENDQVGGEVELRSQAPTARGDQRAYYEVRLNRQGSLKFSRVAFDQATRKRKPVDCQMTREVLERLTDDLEVSLA